MKELKQECLNVGLLVLARLLSWLFHHWHDVAVALIAGFIAGSLLVIWPWKDEVPARSEDGQILVKTVDRVIEARPGTLAEVKAGRVKGEEIVMLGYENWHLPDPLLGATRAALGVMVLGAVLILLLEWGTARSKRRADAAPAP